MSWAAGGVTALTVVGMVGVLGGIGWMATRVIFFSDDIAAKLVREQEQKARDLEEAKLDELQFRLRADRDYRTKDYLTLLRTCKSDFEDFAKKPGIALQSQDIVSQVRELFWSATDQLERSLKMFALADRLNGDQKKQITDQREQVLEEIRESVDHMQSAVTHYRDLIQREQQSDLSSLRDELDTSLRVAKRTEERMRELEGTIDYDSYLKDAKE
jgi:Mg2+ and Co2+ transporter CorA